MPLDFTNTLDNRGDPEREQELLGSYGDLLDFLRQTGALPDHVARKLQARAARETRAASALLGRARMLREELYRVVVAVSENKSPDPDDLAALNAEITAAALHTHLQKKDHGFTWNWAGEADSLERALWPITRGIADLLTSEQLPRIRLCEDEKCAW